jgi:hypothetical protein
MGVVAETGFDVRSRRRNRPLTGLATNRSIEGLDSIFPVSLRVPMSDAKLEVKPSHFADTPKFLPGSSAPKAETNHSPIQ